MRSKSDIDTYKLLDSVFEDLFGSTSKPDEDLQVRAVDVYHKLDNLLVPFCEALDSLIGALHHAAGYKWDVETKQYVAPQSQE